ncbi:hypothetical protein E2C01_025090 [Portunus trituberculatus]|uniref:Uncharacterized protein n=1 Tax=Portunus trituberculatus TaxID=210409 RepID=A0A5B7EGX2_PORTR|nr:hypothetical protein [Portunus trituberculatus]
MWWKSMDGCVVLKLDECVEQATRLSLPMLLDWTNSMNGSSCMEQEEKREKREKKGSVVL